MHKSIFPVKTNAPRYHDELDLPTRLYNFIFEHKLAIYRIVIPVLVLAITVGLSILVTQENPLYAIALFGLPFVVAAALFLEKRLYLGPLVVLLAAGFSPLALPTGTGSVLVDSLLLTVAVLGLWVVKLMIVERRVYLIPSPIYIPAFGFMITSVLSLGWSIIFRDPEVYVPRSFIFVQGASTLIMVISPGIMLLVANFIHRQILMKWMAGLMIAVGILGMLSTTFGWNLPVNNFGLAAMWLMSLATSIALVDKGTSPIFRWFLIAMTGWSIYFNFVEKLSWIAGWLPGLIAVGVILFLRSKKILLGFAVLFAIYVGINFHRFEANFADESTVSGNTRLAAWEINWQFTRDHLLFGMGPAGYTVYYMTFIPMDAMATHSNYIDVLSQTGIIGSVFFLAIFGVLAWRGVVVFLRVRNRGDFLEAISLACLGGLVGGFVIMAFGDWMLPFAYTQTIAGYDHSVYNWLFMGLILALDHMTRPGQNGTMGEL